MNAARATQGGVERPPDRSSTRVAERGGVVDKDRRIRREVVVRVDDEVDERVQVGIAERRRVALRVPWVLVDEADGVGRIDLPRAAVVAIVGTEECVRVGDAGDIDPDQGRAMIQAVGSVAGEPGTTQIGDVRVVGVKLGKVSLHETPPHQLDERLRNLTTIVLTPIELCRNSHEVIFGTVQTREIIQCPQDFIQFAHVPAKQLIHV